MEKLDHSFGTVLSHAEAMAYAIELAQKGIGFVDPNPAVGCVILNERNELIGCGYHQKYGMPHAEVNAIHSVLDKTQLSKATAFVTLEPCGHMGKTPPCSQLLIKHKVKNVFYATSDPNPKFLHSGLETMQDAGINVEQKQYGLSSRLRPLTDKFLYGLKQSKPYVSLKIATSLDGYMGLNNGESKWLSGEESRYYSHRLRNCHDAILVGANTIMNDNPSLNVRLKDPNLCRKLKLIIIDPQFKTENFLKEAKLCQYYGPEDIYIVSNKCCKPYHNITVDDFLDQKINLEQVLSEIHLLGIRSIFVEGGGFTISEFIRQNQYNCLHNFITPHIIGSDTGLSWTKGHNLLSLKNKQSLIDVSFQQIGQDMLYTGFNQ